MLPSPNVKSTLPSQTHGSHPPRCWCIELKCIVVAVRSDEEPLQHCCLQFADDHGSALDSPFSREHRVLRSRCTLGPSAGSFGSQAATAAAIALIYVAESYDPDESKSSVCSLFVSVVFLLFFLRFLVNKRTSTYHERPEIDCFLIS